MTSTTDSGHPRTSLPPLILRDAAATDRVGAAIGMVARPGDVICLAGDLGAGKTALARAGLTARLALHGVAEDIPSPTFTLVQTYEADIPLWHADLYRLTDEDEVWELGLSDAFHDAACFIEWPDRLGALTPARRVEISLHIEGEGRRMDVTAFGEEWAHLLEAIEEARNA